MQPKKQLRLDYPIEEIRKIDGELINNKHLGLRFTHIRTFIEIFIEHFMYIKTYNFIRRTHEANQP